MPARSAASTFSLTPPIGSTSPRRLISPVIATSLRTIRPVKSEASATNIATPGARAVLRRRARGDMHVDVRFLEHFRRDAEALRARLDERQRGLRAFLHHVAQLSGQDELAVARHARRFDEQDVAADRASTRGRSRRPTRRPASRLRPRTCAGRGSPRGRRDRSSPAACHPRRCAPPRCGTRCRSRARDCARRLRACSRR